MHFPASVKTFARQSAACPWRDDQPHRIFYPYGDGEGGYAVLAWDEEDVRIIRKAMRHAKAPAALAVVCADRSLAALLKDRRLEPIDFAEFARRGIGILSLPTGYEETAIEAQLGRWHSETGHRFSPYDSYCLSLVVMDHAVKRPFQGIDLSIYPTVLWPTLYSNWEYIHYLKDEVVAGRALDVLDMFTGSGIVGMGLKHRAPIASISYSDINYWAIHSVRATCAQYPHLQGKTYVSEGLAAIPPTEQYDLIIGNPPHADLPLTAPGVLAGNDPGWEAHRQFFRHAHNHLKPGGEIVFIESASHSQGARGFYERIHEHYPALKAGRSVKMKNNICYIQHIALA
jgi:hypothetical protein